MDRTTLLLVFFLTGTVLTERTDVTVTSKAGTFIGFREEVQLEGQNVTMSKFLGIPYAESPVGDLRFRKTVSKATLTKPYQAQQFGPACLQFYGMFPLDASTHSEDCLYLNIFKPEMTSEGDALPVMVWIHGGGFVFGMSDNYIGDELAANGPVIVVTINYRLSVWGFLSTGDSNTQGNYGLWDQHFAIKWVNRNIAAFGGDPNKVTIFGESAGSASTIFQGLYLGNKGLFQRIIAQSGTASAPWAIRPNPQEDAKLLASLVDCDRHDVAKMVDCLRKTPVDKINATINDVTKFDLALPFPFVPSVGGEFIPSHPKDLMEINNDLSSVVRQQFASYDLMIGINSGEGGTSLQPAFGVFTSPEDFMPNKTAFTDTLIPYLLSTLYGKGYPSILNDIVSTEYTDWNDPENPLNIRQKFLEMHSDWMFLGCTQRAIRAHSAMSEQRSYLYHFDLLPYKSLLPRPSWFNKPLHADELLYVFGKKMEMDIPGWIESRDLQQWEKTAAENIMTLWTNFAKTGNPNKPRDLGVDWLPYMPAMHRYLEIQSDVTASRMKERLNERRATFWDVILPTVAEAAKCGKAAPEGTCSKDSCSP